MTDTVAGLALQIYVTGSDGVAPIHQPNDPWKQWNINNIYAVRYTDGSVIDPTVGEKRWIPNVGDWVIDTALFKYYEVIAVDEFTGFATIRYIQAPKDPGELNEDDILLGPGPGTQSDTYRCMLDQSVMPFRLVVDHRLSIGGSMTKYAKIFRGSNIGPSGTVVGVFYDEQGNLLGDEVPLELSTVGENAVNYTKRTVMPSYTKTAMANGEIVTVVFYDDDGHVVSTRQLLVWNTAFIRSTDRAVKYVTGISLKSPFLSAADPKLIQYPINLTLRSMIAVGVVHYSDGTTRELNVTSSGKFQIHGFENFVATIVGQELPLVLTYKLSPDEVAYGVSVGETKHISEEFRAVTVKAEGSYSLKLYAYPVWIDRINGYRLEWFMYNLDRQTVYYVTPWVKMGASSRAFDPMAYGISQRLIANLNLKDVNAAFTNYNFTQTIEIVLRQAGDEAGDPWNVAFDPNQNPQYGTGVYASCDFVNYNYWKLRLDFGAASLGEWLEKVYYNTKPLTDPSREAAPVIPDFFRIRFSNSTGQQNIECQLSQWNQEMIVGNGLTNNGTLFIEFFRRTNDNDLELAVAGLVIRQTNA